MQVINEKTGLFAIELLIIMVYLAAFILAKFS